MTTSRFCRCLLLSSFLTVFITPIQPKAAPDPQSVIAVATAILNLMEKNPQSPNYGADNRELIEAIHERLDGIEDQLLRLSEQMNILPDVIQKEVREAQEYEIGINIGAIGEFYYDEKGVFDQDLAGQHIEPANGEWKSIYRDTLLTLSKDISIYSRNLAARPSSDNVGVLSIALAAFLETQIRIDLMRDFGGSKLGIRRAAARYVRLLERSTKASERTSLAAMVEKLRSSYIDLLNSNGFPVSDLHERTGAELRNNVNSERTGACHLLQDFVYNDDRKWMESEGLPLKDEKGDDYDRVVWIAAVKRFQWYIKFPKIESTQSHERFTPEINKTYDEDHSFNRRNAQSFDGIGVGNRSSCQYIFNDSLGSKFEWCKSEFSPGVPNCHEPTNYQSRSAPQHRTIAYNDGFYLGLKEKIEKHVSSINILTSVEDVVGLALKYLRRLENGEFSASPDEVASVINAIPTDAVPQFFRRLERLEREAESQAYKKALMLQRQQINEMISDQDEALAEIFQSAAKDAKTNRVLSLLKTGLNIVKQALGQEKEGYSPASKKIDFNGTLIASELKRSEIVSVKNVGERMDGLLAEFHYWGGIYNSYREFERMDAAFETERARLGDAVSKKFWIITDGKRFHSLIPFENGVGPQLRKPGMKIFGPVTIIKLYI